MQALLFRVYVRVFVFLETPTSERCKLRYATALPALSRLTSDGKEESAAIEQLQPARVGGLLMECEQLETAGSSNEACRSQRGQIQNERLAR